MQMNREPRIDRQDQDKVELSRQVTPTNGLHNLEDTVPKEEGKRGDDTGGVEQPRQMR